MGTCALFQNNSRDDQLSCLSGLVLWGNPNHTCASPGWTAALWSHGPCLQIVDSGRLVVSTKCGHVFCSQCLRDALTTSHTCPTCRKRLTHRQYHPLYVWHRHTGKCGCSSFGFSLFINWLCWMIRVRVECILLIIVIVDYSSYSLFFYFLIIMFSVNKCWLFGIWIGILGVM